MDESVLNNSLEMAANAPKAKPCSPNLVPSTKKHKPRRTMPRPPPYILLNFTPPPLVLTTKRAVTSIDNLSYSTGERPNNIYCRNST